MADHHSPAVDDEVRDDGRDEEGAEGVFESLGPPSSREPRDIERPSLDRPMVFLALAWITGLSLGRHIPLHPWFALWTAAAVLAAVAVVRHRTRLTPWTANRLAPLLLVVPVLPAWVASNRVVRQDARADRIAAGYASAELTRVEGIVAEPPVRSEGRTDLVLRDVTLASPPVGVREDFPLRLLVAVKTDDPAGAPLRVPVPGQRYAAWGRLAATERGRFPHDFDAAEWMHGRGVGARLAVDSASDLRRLRGGEGFMLPLHSGLAVLRARIARSLAARLSPGDFAFASALFLGDRSALTPETRENFRRTGMSHILSVSGMHTGFILTVALAAGSLLFLPPRRLALAAMIVLLVYMALTGFRPPVVRATLMAWVVLGGQAAGRQAGTLSALATAAFLTLVLDPRNLVRTDWILSYTAMLSILLLATPIYLLPMRRAEKTKPWEMTRRQRAWRAAIMFLWLPLATLCAVQIGMMPIQAGYFQTLSLAGFILQPVALLLAFVMVALAVVMSLPAVLGPVGVVAAVPASWIAAPVYAAFDWLLEWGGSRGWATIHVAPLPPLPLVLYYGTLLLGPHLRFAGAETDRARMRARVHVAIRMGMCAALAVWSPAFAPAAPRGLLEIVMLDVGQGDCLLIRFPEGGTGLIDGGRFSSSGGSDSAPARYMRAHGIHRLDFAMATHADADHVGGLPPVLAHFDVGLFLTGPDIAWTDAFREMTEVIERRRIPVRRIEAGERLRISESVEVRVLNPLPDTDNNDASVTLLLDYDNIEILLTGDIEAKAERAILRAGLAEDIEVLKVAHHGSRSSTTEEFLSAFRPELALVSAGRENRYGHPHPTVIERLNAHGAAVLRTDEMGTIRILTDGRRIRAERYGE